MLSRAEDWRPVSLFVLLLGLSVFSELFKLETQAHQDLGDVPRRSSWR